MKKQKLRLEKETEKIETDRRALRTAVGHFELCRHSAGDFNCLFSMKGCTRHRSERCAVPLSLLKGGRSYMPTRDEMPGWLDEMPARWMPGPDEMPARWMPGPDEMPARW